MFSNVWLQIKILLSHCVTVSYKSTYNPKGSLSKSGFLFKKIPLSLWNSLTDFRWVYIWQDNCLVKRINRPCANIWQGINLCIPFGPRLPDSIGHSITCRKLCTLQVQKGMQWLLNFQINSWHIYDYTCAGIKKEKLSGKRSYKRF